MIRKTLVINGVTRNLVLDKDETLATVLREHLLLTGCHNHGFYSAEEEDSLKKILKSGKLWKKPIKKVKSKLLVFLISLLMI